MAPNTHYDRRTDIKEAIGEHDCPLCDLDDATDKSVLAVTWPVYESSKPAYDPRFPAKIRTVLEREFDVELDDDETIIHCSLAAAKLGGLR